MQYITLNDANSFVSILKFSLNQHFRYDIDICRNKCVENRNI